MYVSFQKKLTYYNEGEENEENKNAKSLFLFRARHQQSEMNSVVVDVGVRSPFEREENGGNMNDLRGERDLPTNAHESSVERSIFHFFMFYVSPPPPSHHQSSSIIIINRVLSFSVFLSLSVDTIPSRRVYFEVASASHFSFTFS